MKKIVIRFLLLATLLGGGWAGHRYFQRMPQRQLPVATQKVRKGDVVVRAFARGELAAVRAVTLTAPNLFSTVQVTKLAPLGSLAKEKDLIVEFDDSERRTALEEADMEVQQVDEQIKKAQADLAMRNNQDAVDLLRARFAVRRAELEVKRNELLAEIDAKKNLLNLEEARRRLKQLESDVKSRQEQSEAEIAVLRERRNKALIDVSREKQRIAQSKILSSITGLVSIRQNRGSFMGSFGQQVPDIREGDSLQPGAQVADVLDLSELEVIAKVGELDRANLTEGQDANLKLDAIPEKTFHGKIKSMSATATANPFSGDPGKKFDVIFSVDMKELMTGLGAKPDQIRRILETAEHNAKKAPARPAMAAFGNVGAAPGAMQGGAPGGASGGSPQMPGPQMAIVRPGGPGGSTGGGPQMPGPQMPGSPQMPRPGGPGGPGNPGAPGSPGGLAGPGASTGARGAGGGSEEQRRAMQQMLDQLTPEGKKEIQKMIGKKQIQDLSPDERRKVFTRVREIMQLSAASSIVGGFNEQDRASAKLPLPPEEDSQLDVLLRPGLLADVEIIVQKIPNAVYIPNQAVFEKDGKQFVYVQTGNRFEPRYIKPAKRSESVMVIAEGLKANEVIALADPTAKPGAGKKSEKSSGASKSMGGVPSGK